MTTSTDCPLTTWAARTGTTRTTTAAQAATWTEALAA